MGVLRGWVVVLLCDLDAVGVWLDRIECVLKLHLTVHDLSVDDTTGSDLAEHLKGIEPRVDSLQAHCLVNGSNGDTLDVDGTAVGFGGDFLAFAADGVSIFLWSNIRQTYSLNPT